MPKLKQYSCYRIQYNHNDITSLDIMNFFKSKSKDLNNNSEESTKSSKKKREGSLNDSSVSENTDVFADGLKPHECVSILFNCLQNLTKETKII